MNRIKSLALISSIAIATAFSISCSSDDGDDKGSGGGKAVYAAPVEYGGETYKTVVIGTQTWMAKNLNYKVEGSKCYNDSISYCEKYGRLYDWATAMGFEESCNTSRCDSQINEPHQGICPDGWHLPSGAEWLALEEYIEGIYGWGTVGKHLKAKNEWDNKGKKEYKEDTYGFAALPGGWGFLYAQNEIGYRFQSVGTYGAWLSSTEATLSDKDFISLFGEDDVNGRGHDKKTYFYSVRCLKD